MKIEIKAPTLPESVPDGTIATWHKSIGDSVKRDELLVDIETDKVVIEVVSPTDGVLEKIMKTERKNGKKLIQHLQKQCKEWKEALPAFREQWKNALRGKCL